MVVGVAEIAAESNHINIHVLEIHRNSNKHDTSNVNANSNN